MYENLTDRSARDFVVRDRVMLPPSRNFASASPRRYGRQYDRRFAFGLRVTFFGHRRNSNPVKLVFTYFHAFSDITCLIS